MIANFNKHPLTTVLGAVLWLAVSLASYSQANGNLDTVHFGIGFAVFVAGSIARDPE